MKFFMLFAAFGLSSAVVARGELARVDAKLRTVVIPEVAIA